VNVGQRPSSTDEDTEAELAACRREISKLRESESFFYWLFVATWIAFATGVLLTSQYGVLRPGPIEEWYDWPLAWAGCFLGIGVALTAVVAVTMFLHHAWWEWFGGDRRDHMHG
jgi:hypothetical protein